MGPALHRALLIVPGWPRAAGGNRTTALRWAKLLRELGWRTRVSGRFAGEGCELLVVLNAEKSRESIEAWRALAERPRLVVALTGTDLYGGEASSGKPDQRLAAAAAGERLLVLQAEALAVLPSAWRERARVLYQSALASPAPAPRTDERFRVVLLAGLRAVKDPLLAARAVRLLPESSRIEIWHAGEAIDPRLTAEARGLQGARYRYLGGLRRAAAASLLASADLVLSTSRNEGGPNALSEALAADRPILATRIPGHEGLLGKAHPGLFPVGDEQELARLLRAAELEPALRAALLAAGRERVWLVDRARERGGWASLLSELGFEVLASPSR